MTKEELYDNYEFKVTKRTLMSEFPFIKDVYVQDDKDINTYLYYIWLTVDIDPYQMGQMYGLKVSKFVTRALKRGEPYWAPYLSTLMSGGVDDTYPITQAMEKVIDGVHKSPALPSELKLPKELEIASYVVKTESLPPDIMSVQ